MPDLSKRAVLLEQMDDLQISGADLNQALRELDGINYILGGNYVTLKGIDMLLERGVSTRTVHIADLGCGSGDILRRIRRLTVKRHLDAALTGFDANPNVIQYATTHTPSECEIRYQAINIFSEAFGDQSFDIVTGTLFFHHFTSEQLIHFFRELRKQTRVGLVINDIHRHWFAYYAIKILTRMFSRSAMVKHDAPASVMRAFKRSELRAIMEGAGFHHYRIKWCWAFRWQIVVWLK